MFTTESAHVDAEEIRAEVARLDALRFAASSAPQRKRELLIEIRRMQREPMLIFTGAVATALDIGGAMQAGVMTSRAARPLDALDAFRRGRIDTLVCTDLASEGLNLQRAGVVVHYDIPWNPVKLDQRNGRAWRIGQTRETVHAIYFIPETRRTRIIRTVAAKNRTRRQLLNVGRALSPAALTLLALPPHLPCDAPAVALIRKLRARGLSFPPTIARRYRAGVERVFDEMSREYLDEQRLRDLLALLECEIIDPGNGSLNRR